MAETVLPFEINPINKCLHRIAFPMSIIQGNAIGDMTPWLCGRCSSLHMTIDWKKHEITGLSNWTDDLYAVKDGILNQETISMTPDKYEDLSIDLIAMLRMLITKRCYVIGNYDEYFVPGKSPFQRFRYIHDFIIFGFDDLEGFFYTAGYLPNGKYDILKTRYSDMKNAIESIYPYPVRFEILSYRKDARFVLNAPKTVNGMISYLSPDNKIQKGYMFEEEEYSGIDVMTAMNKYYREQISRNRYIDSRYTRLIMEHKYYMYIRAHFLQKNGLIIDSLADVFHQNYTDSTIIHLLGMKLNMTGNPDLYLCIDKHFSQIIEKERESVPKMIEAFKSIKG